MATAIHSLPAVTGLQSTLSSLAAIKAALKMIRRPSPRRPVITEGDQLLSNSSICPHVIRAFMLQQLLTMACFSRIMSMMPLYVSVIPPRQQLSGDILLWSEQSSSGAYVSG